MNESPNFGSRDLDRLQYLNALDAGDLETVANFWERASHDPELESLLVELEAGLILENGIMPAARSKRSHRWNQRSGLVACLMAASLLAGLAWGVWTVIRPVLPQQQRKAVSVKDPKLMMDDDLVAPWQRTNPASGKNALTAFSWPLEEKTPIGVGSSIPANLFD